MKRRDVLALLGGMSVAAMSYSWPAAAQQLGATLRLGVLLYGRVESERQIDIALKTGQSAQYVSRIHKGAKPVDLPVIRPTRFELAINMRTSKAMGIEVAGSILARADDVIE
jgi:hypothetical protein